ncbi:aminopeptidase P family protein [Marivivens donghaensis]|uniref:Aminopeptidase P family protein n=1 Tax=Marivivens donghaensis TaxID=1699413 RepID=A0ABX0W0P9_9RHOB|nr:aminopeptidase P family protein [Marivivens donghaensis]NIY72477.1 aminopeptidase P family protein [Marivivens donghaensis]
MFQQFTNTHSGKHGPERLAALREQMQTEGLDGFIVPRSDMFQGETVADCDDRLAWLTGFSGSAGYAIILADQAGVFVDGRYRLQVREQVEDCYTPIDWPEVTLRDWLEQNAAGKIIGFDAWLHPVNEIKTLRDNKADVELRAVDNLVDKIWTDRPAPPAAKFFAQPEEFAGESAASKRTRLAEGLREAGTTAAVITLPDSIAWLLNIRGEDVSHTPAPHAFAILHDTGRCDLFAREGKADEIMDHLGEDVAVLPFEGFEAALLQLSSPVLIDANSCPQIVAEALAGAEVETFEGRDPCVLPKALKNATELAGMQAAHDRDAIAMCRFLAWFEANSTSGITEIDVVKTLEGFRRDTNALRDISFDTISGAGPNGAVIHYRVTEETNRTLGTGELIVVDSGAQYQDGTTDITRTLAIGEAGADERHCYTQVLRGMVAVSRARFPVGVNGGHLDALARQFLWAEGMDYDHGTGHGVGAYLGVHEGPCGISRRAAQIPLQPGMVLSNEPGYYRNGAFGIRVENLIFVANVEGGIDAHRNLLGFETLTYVPFERKLIDKALLSKEEVAWIDAYHAKVLDKVGPHLDLPTRGWLSAACAPL